MRAGGRMVVLTGMVLAATAGCGTSDAGPSHPTYPVKGKVVMADGKPLRGGIVTFLPRQEPAQQASGLIAADGSYELSTYKQGDGAVEGVYDVSVEPSPEALEGLGKPAKRKLGSYIGEGTLGLNITVKPEPNVIDSIVLK